MHSFQTMTLFTQECCSTCLVMTHFAKRNLVSLVFPFSCQEIKTLKKKIRKRVFAMKKSIIKVALRSITSWIKLRFAPGNDPRFKIINDDFSWRYEVLEQTTIFQAKSHTKIAWIKNNCYWNSCTSMARSGVLLKLRNTSYLFHPQTQTSSMIS